MTEKLSAKCPECDAELQLEDVIEGEIVVCSDCGAIWKWSALIQSSWTWRQWKRRTGASSPVGRGP